VLGLRLEVPVMENEAIGKLTRACSRWKYPYAELAKENDLRNISEMGSTAFGPLAFPENKFKSLFKINSKIVWRVVDKKGWTKGYVDIWVVKEDFGNDLIGGRKRESDVQPGDILAENQLSDAAGGFIYIAALVNCDAFKSKESNGEELKRRGLGSTFDKLALATFDRVGQIYGQNPRLSKIIFMADLLADGSPGPGARYLKDFGFEEISTSLDGCPVNLLDLHEERGRFADLLERIRKRREQADQQQSEPIAKAHGMEGVTNSSDPVPSRLPNQEPSPSWWKNPGVLAALIAAIATLSVGYWQFLYKPTKPVTLTFLVEDEANGKGIAHAHVILQGSTGQVEIYTDSLGTARFVIDPDREGKLHVIVSAEKFHDKDEEVDALKTDSQYPLYLQHEDCVGSSADGGQETEVHFINHSAQSTRIAWVDQ
jgi:hypothetical protein